MEDPKVMAADCIVISCCCQCLILQLLIFLLLKLPWKLFCKTRDYTKRRLGKTGGNLRKSVAEIVENQAMVKLYYLSSREGSISSSRSGGACMEEVEKVLEDLAQICEVVFGSFWGQQPDQVNICPPLPLTGVHPKM